jgi:hypothetical protein
MRLVGLCRKTYDFLIDRKIATPLRILEKKISTQNRHRLYLGSSSAMVLIYITLAEFWVFALAEPHPKFLNITVCVEYGHVHTLSVHGRIRHQLKQKFVIRTVTPPHGQKPRQTPFRNIRRDLYSEMLR